MSDAIRNRLWIDNDWEAAASGETFPTLNPATGEVVTEVARGGAADIDRAVRSAKAALASPDWREMNPHARSVVLWKLADLIEANGDEMASLETRDNGKTWFESRKVDVPSTVGVFRYFAGMADKIFGLRVFEDEEGKMNLALADVGGAVLLISQFTLMGDCRRGRRPSFVAAAPPERCCRWPPGSRRSTTSRSRR